MAHQIHSDRDNWIKAEIRQLEQLRARRGLYNSEKVKLEQLYQKLQMILPLDKGQEKIK